MVSLCVFVTRNESSCETSLRAKLHSDCGQPDIAQLARHYGVRLLLLTERAKIEGVLDYVTQSSINRVVSSSE